MEASRLKNLYNNEIIKKMMEEYNIKNKLQVPKLTKIVLSKGLDRNQDSDKAAENLSNIASQKAVKTKAKKSISQFSVRIGHINGCMVTLRGEQMYFFLEKLINVALISDREFIGIKKKSFNKQKSNVSISMGIKDEKIFPEIVVTSLKKEGFNITFVTNGNNIDQSAFLLNAFGLPIIGDK